MNNFLENDKIRLRAVEPEDVKIITEVESDSSQWIDNCMCAPISYQMITEYALSYDADPFRAGQIRLMIESKETKSIIGIIDLYQISAQNRTAFIGIYILPRYRRQGLGLESLSILEKYAYFLLNLNNFGAKIVYNNVESINLFKKAGFTHSGTLPEWIQTGKVRRDLMIFTKKLLT